MVIYHVDMVILDIDMGYLVTLVWRKFQQVAVEGEV
jgi:hypothetical protein